MNTSLRKQVLESFKILHRTRQKVFQDDSLALEKARDRINEEFRSKKNVTDITAIKELLRLSKEVEHELRTTVVQAREIEPGRYELRITADTIKTNNTPYKQCDNIK